MMTEESYPEEESMSRVFLAALAAGCLVAGTPAFAQQIIKATDVHPLGYPTVEAIVRLGNKLEKATNGKYKLQMYPSMQLGGEKEMTEQAQVGALQIARISVGPIGTIVDDFNVFNMPFVFKDEAQMRKVIDGPIGPHVFDKLTNTRPPPVGLGSRNAGPRNDHSHT